MKYVYPKLFGKDLFFIRLGGNGLANCMLVAARAAILASRYEACIIRPTWERFSFFNYIRLEKDKRTYRNLFRGGVKKTVLIYGKKYTEMQLAEFAASSNGILIVEGFSWKDSPFQLLADNYEIVNNYFLRNFNPKALRKVYNFNFTNVIAVHVRLGDYKNMHGLQTPIDWYVDVIEKIKEYCCKETKFIVFSDGKDEELLPLLKLDYTQRVFFGNALADIVAMSKCKLIVGSSSSFSAWGAFLGQKPFVAKKMHFGHILKDHSKEFIFDGSKDFDEYLYTLNLRN